MEKEMSISKTSHKKDRSIFAFLEVIYSLYTTNKRGISVLEE